MLTKRSPGSTVSTMPRAPPNASNRAASVTARASSADVSSVVGLSSDVTGYSRPRGLNSYFGLNSTRRPRLIEIRPDAISLRPGSIPMMERLPSHTTSRAAEPSNSSASRAGTPARGRSVTVRKVPVTVTTCRSWQSPIRVQPAMSASSRSSSDSSSSCEEESRSSMRRNRPAGFSGRGTALMSEAYRGALTVTYPWSRRPEPAGARHRRGPLRREAGVRGGGCRASLLEAVSHAGLGDEVPGVRRVGLQLAPQLCHVHAQVVGLLPVGRPPHLPQQLLLRDEAAAVADQDLQQVPLGRRQPHVLAAPVDLLRGQVDGELAGVHDAVLLAPGRF